jgi:hypothetical protein
MLPATAPNLTAKRSTVNALKTEVTVKILADALTVKMLRRKKYLRKLKCRNSVTYQWELKEFQLV